MNHLIKQHPKRPNIHPIVIMRVENHLRSHVLISPTKGPPFCVDIFRSPPKITQLNVPKLINKQVLRLDVSVHDVIQVKVLDCLDGLCEVDEGFGLGELVFGVLVVK